MTIEACSDISGEWSMGHRVVVNRKHVVSVCRNTHMQDEITSLSFTSLAFASVPSTHGVYSSGPYWPMGN